MGSRQLAVVVFMVASSLAGAARAGGEIAPPPQAPHAPVPDGAVATWLSLQLLGGGHAQIALQLSRGATAREQVVDDRTLVVEVPGFELSRTGTWGHVDMAAYDSVVASLDIEATATATPGIAVVVHFKQPGFAHAGVASVAVASDGYHYLRIGVGDVATTVATAEPDEPVVAAGPPSNPAHDDDDRAPPVVILRHDQILIGPDTKYGPRVNVSAAIGFNGPAGAIGVDVDYRVTHHIAVGVAGGVGAWGPRVTPNAKLEYHFPGGEVFLEGGIGLNFGGHITDTIDGADHSYQANFVPTADLAIGFRKRVWVPWLWTGLQVGTSIAMLSNRFTPDHAGDMQSITDAQALSPGEPPFLIAFSSGFSF